MNVPVPSAMSGMECVFRFPGMEKGIAPGCEEQILLGPVLQEPLWDCQIVMLFWHLEVRS